MWGAGQKEQEGIYREEQLFFMIFHVLDQNLSILQTCLGTGAGHEQEWCSEQLAFWESQWPFVVPQKSPQQRTKKSTMFKLLSARLSPSPQQLLDLFQVHPDRD